MARIIVNGCFDLLHEGHKEFLLRARAVGAMNNRLIVAVNTDESAKLLKVRKWGAKYPIDDLNTRIYKLKEYADYVISFSTEKELHDLIEIMKPCILCKGPDYAGKRVTGDDIAPVIILDTPEPEEVKRMKLEVYGVTR